MTLVPSCEEATSSVPSWFVDCFSSQPDALHSDESWAPGALNLAQAFSIRFGALLAHNEASRLLIDLTRNPANDDAFSRFTRHLPEETRKKIVERHHKPFLKSLLTRIHDATQRQQNPIHVSFNTRPLEEDAVTWYYSAHRPEAATWLQTWKQNYSQILPQTTSSIQPATPNDLQQTLENEFPLPFFSIRVVANRNAFLNGTPVKWDALKKALIQSIPLQSS